MNYFFCIGAQKAGTTWLFQALKSHHKIVLPPIKELHFFNELEIYSRYSFPKGLYHARKLLRRRSRILLTTLYNALNKLIKIKNKKINAYFNRFESFEDYTQESIKWIFKYIWLSRRKDNVAAYKTLIDELYVKDKMVGEITPAYSILTTEIIEILYKYFPDAKIIFILRNPVDREWADIKMKQIRYKSYKTFDKEKLMKIIPQRIPEKIVHRSNYVRTLKNFSTVYPRENIIIKFYDELKENPLAFLNDILSKLEIDELNEIESTKRVNKGIEIDITPEIEKKLYLKYSDMIDEMCVMFKDSAINYPEIWQKKKNLVLGEK